MGNPSRHFHKKKKGKSEHPPLTHPGQAGEQEHLAQPSGSVKDRFVRKPEVLNRFAISNSGLYKAINEGRFPAPHHPFGARVSVWLESELDAHMAKLIGNSSQEVAA